MHNILIVGNITKDVYLRLDNRKNHFETDQNHVNWLNLAFDGSSHRYFSRFSLYGGSGVSLEVFSRFGLQSAISDTNASFTDGCFTTGDDKVVFRYILCQDNTVSYLAPSDIRETTWQAPKTAPEWIYLDRSAKLNRTLVEEILAYLDAHSATKLAFFLERHSNQNASFIKTLIKRTDFLIADVPVLYHHPHILKIDRHSIEYAGKRVFWQLGERQDLMTNLASHITIGASVFACLVKGKSVTDAILIARANVENSKLGSSANLSTLEGMIADDYYLVETVPTDDANPDRTIERTATKMLSAGKGILAADESGGSIHKKFEKLAIPDDAQHRRDYRNLFFTTPDLEKYVNGVILFDETARQHADDGRDFITFLSAKGIIPGIKVDQGLANFPDSPEKYTKGLDGLAERLAEYYRLGARFAKWRAAFTHQSAVEDATTESLPSLMAIQKNAKILADYAKACQNAKLVPIVEPEFVYDGDYSIADSAAITGKILDRLFAELKNHNVNLKACILKVNMVLAGKRHAEQSSAETVGRATATVLREHVPDDLAGVVFLSGGQTPEQATANLQAVTNNGPFPWPVSFSFARALQDPALQSWHGDNANADSAREAFRQRLIANHEALQKHF